MPKRGVLHRKLTSGLIAISSIILLLLQPTYAQAAEDEIAQLKAEIERLKLEKERLTMQAEILAKQNELVRSQSEGELADAKARAEVEKAIAQASKEQTSAELDREYALFEKLKGVDFSKLGVAGDFAASTTIPASLRAKAQAEVALEQAISQLCGSKPMQDALAQAAAQRVIIDDGGKTVATIAGGVLAFEQLKRSADRLNALNNPAAPAVAGALAAIQGLGILSNATRLFRTDTQAAVEEMTFDVTHTVQPLVEKHCTGTEVLQPTLLTLSGALDVERKDILDEIARLNQELTRARDDQQRRQKELIELRKKPDQNAAEIKAKEQQEIEAAPVIEQGASVEKSLNPGAINDMAFAEHARKLLNQPTTLFLHVQAKGEARRVVKKNAWTSAKAFATGSALVRITVRKANGQLVATSARYVDAEPISITKLAKAAVSMDQALMEGATSDSDGEEDGADSPQTL